MKESLKKYAKAILTKRNQVVVATMVNLGRSRNVDVLKSEYTNDYIRLSQLDLAIQEIIDANIAGDMAEVGVYKGNFAAVLNRALPDRNLYLFDTFEGFDTNQEEFDRKNHGLKYERDFTDTSVDYVLSQMVNIDKCIVKKGFFPATAAGLEQNKFCLVSLDPDLYQPIFDGLEFFYDRLSPGGFIFVHDYNNCEFPGAKKAVRDFSESRNVPFIPITDFCGSAIFRR